MKRLKKGKRDKEKSVCRKLGKIKKNRRHLKSIVDLSKAMVQSRL